jgi:translation initiation factor 2B subunit (eIF-2B alpha/beta/delta family)
MSNPYEIRGQLEEIFNNIDLATLHMIGTKDVGEAAVSRLKESIEELKRAVVKAKQMRASIQNALTQLQFLVSNKGTLETMHAIGNLERALEMTDNFINRTKLQFENIEKLIAVIGYARMDQELGASDTHLQVAKQELNRYYHQI